MLNKFKQMPLQVKLSTLYLIAMVVAALIVEPLLVLSALGILSLIHSIVTVLTWVENH